MGTLKEIITNRLEETKDVKKEFLENTETLEFGVYLPDYKMFVKNNGESPSIKHLQTICKVKSDDILEVLQGWNNGWSRVNFSEKFQEILETL